MEELRYLLDNCLDGSFSTGCWTNGSMAGNPANAPSVRSTWLSRQPATSKMMPVLTNVRGLVYSRCPRSCLMAHSDRGHPSVWSPGPAVPIAIKKKAGGLSPPRVPRGTPSLNTDEKEPGRREVDERNSNVSAGPPHPRPPDGRVGPPTLFHRKLREKMPWIQPLVPRLRLQDRMPLDVRAWFPW